MRLSVAVCTWNRAAMLQRGLRQMCRLVVPPGVEWELLVIDNGCTDYTAEVVASYADRLPIRRVIESEPGLSHARNRAVAEAGGSYLLWTDDDALVEPGWLAAYAEAFRRWPDAALFGGPIVPEFEGTPPDWLRRTLPVVGGMYAARDLGPEAVPLASPRTLPYGCNYATRTAEQRRFPYHPALGRGQGTLGMGSEEIDVMRSLLGTGATGRWVPHAALRHVIPPERQTVDYVGGHRRGDAAYATWRELQAGAGAPRRPLARLLAALRLEARYRTARLVVGPERWIRDLLRARTAWGELDAIRAASGSAGSTARAAE